MTDRELLELAAKATGKSKVIKIYGVWCADGYPFNPLTDDGDALRLAVKLGLLGSPKMQLVWVWAMGDKDPHAATRRAIVQAAAEIGKGIEEHDLNKCPKCGGIADNGHDRCHPPNPYYCSACMAEGVGQPEQKPVAYMMVNRAHGLQPSLHWEPQEDWHNTWECVPLYN